MPPTKLIRILCVDDHPIVLEGLNAVISIQPDMVVVGQAADGAAAIEAFRRLGPDVTLMDLHLPGVTGIMALRRLRHEFPHACIVVLTTYNSEEHVRDALEAGARGYLLKESLRTDLLRAIRAVYNGERFIPKEVALRLADSISRDTMTARELEILTHMSKGLRNREIGEQLRITVQTVKVHVKNILWKLGVEDRVQAILTALRRGLVRLD